MKDGEKGAILQRDKETFAVAPHIPCGVLMPAQMRNIADVAEKYGAAALKITSAARIAMVGIKGADIDAVWKDLGITPGHAVGLCVRSIKACPGTAFCRLAKQDSLGMGMKLDAKYHGVELPSKTKIGVSGCANQCAETCIKDIGLVGSKNGWKVLVGGCGASTPRLADTLTESLSDEAALLLIDKVVAYYRENGKKLERIGKMIDRVGFDAFKSAVLGE
ncbi:MAG: NAD(P)/FAD-dependent oxidoreductase [Desulfobacterales bacterium]|nr:NAD(P)/FAD-dependent oxidoreductase [Desulfobacterales bacterium]